MRQMAKGTTTGYRTRLAEWVSIVRTTTTPADLLVSRSRNATKYAGLLNLGSTIAVSPRFPRAE